MTAKVSAIYLVQNVIVNLSLVIMITKIKLYGDKINTNFQGKKIPKQNAPYKCLSRGVQK